MAGHVVGLVHPRGGTSPTTSSADARIAWLAGRQYGVVRREQLTAAGLSRRAIEMRIERRRLHRVYRGVYAVGHGGLAREGRWLAGVMAGGAGAALSHLCCAAHWNVGEVLDDFVTVVAPVARKPSGPLRVYRCRNLAPEDVTVHRGIPVTTVARLFVDLTDVLTPHSLANVMHEADYRRLSSPAQTRAAMERAHGRHNLAVLEAALALNGQGSAGTKSPHEETFLALLRAARLPTPRVNTKAFGFEVDFVWHSQRLVVEIDGGSGHARPRTRREDARRDRTARDAGYTVLRFTDTDLVKRSDQVIASVTRRLGWSGLYTS